MRRALCVSVRELLFDVRHAAHTDEHQRVTAVEEVEAIPG